jgi:soluble lytic murein transglycosylase
MFISLLVLVIAAIPLLFGARPDTAASPAVQQLAQQIGLASPDRNDAAEPAAVDSLMRDKRYWRAARLMRQQLARAGQARPADILLASRAEAGWGGWQRVSALLEGRGWLSGEAGGEGWFWLGRAREEAGSREQAVQAYSRYLEGGDARSNPNRRTVAELRRGLLLLRAGRLDEGTAGLAAARDYSPEAARWLDLLSADALAERGDTARVRTLVRDFDGGMLERRGKRTHVRAYLRAGNAAGARALALRYASQISGDATRAALTLDAARAALSLGDRDAAREGLRAALALSPNSAAGQAAARELAELGGLTAGDRLAIARNLDRQGSNASAAAQYRAWLASGAGTAAERQRARLDLGRALFDQGEYAAAEKELRKLADAPAATAASAMYLAARAEYRRGQRSSAMNSFARVAERYPKTDGAANALFLVADLSHDDGDTAKAQRLYREVADHFRGHNRTGLSLMRLGGIAFQRGDLDKAAAVYDEYRSSYPQGVNWMQATYWSGRAHEAQGDSATARSRYRAAVGREAMSYYALLSADRLGTKFWPMQLAESPAADPAAQARIDRWVRGVDLLRDAGLYDEAEAEVNRFIAATGDDPRLLYPLAETLNERGYTTDGIPIGWKLNQRAAEPNLRLLRILYPFPYRPMIVAEARERGLDPFRVAAMIRQESMFKARIASGAGARGLMQIMPETGRLLARSNDIENWDTELLYHPEINVHLGTQYLAEQMQAYDGFLPYVFSAYNAGPHRVERWKKTFPERGDLELFTERIPYEETREYVKILTRNTALYEALYGESAAK